MNRIRLGRMAFINTLPVDWGLVQSKYRDHAEIVRGAPTTLNRLLAEGRLDISPVSSVAAAEHAEDWLVFDRLCIGCKGEVGSVILQSDVPAEELGGRSIAVTAQSATAVRLLEILLSRRWKSQAKLVTVHDDANAKSGRESRESHRKGSPFPSSAAAESLAASGSQRRGSWFYRRQVSECLGLGRSMVAFENGPERRNRESSCEAPLPRLLIGDSALRVAQSNPAGLVYDLGRAWFDHTGLGFVFGLWCVRKSFAEQYPDKTRMMFNMLSGSYARGRAEIEKVTAEAAGVTGLPEFVVKNYFNKLIYELDDELWNGLNYFLELLGHDPGRLQRFSETEQWTERLGALGG